MELWQRFTSRARRAVLMAHDEAQRMEVQLISTEHLLLGLMRLREGVAAEVLESLGLDLERLRSELRGQIEVGARSEGSADVSFTPEAQRVLTRAYAEARQLGDYHIGTEHILIGLLREGRGAAYRLLRRHGADLPMVRHALREVSGRSDERGEEEGETSETPTLDYFSRDLTQLAREGKLDPIVNRETETQRVIQILCRRTKNNPCLLGEAGVGKTAIVEGLAQKIVNSQVPSLLHGRRLVALDLAGLVAGTKYRGEFEDRMKRVLDEIRESDGQIVVFLGELQTIVGTGAAEGAMDASNILKPGLARGELQCIGAATMDEYRKYIEKTPSLERRFQAVKVEEPNAEQTVEVLRGIRERYEQFHVVQLTEEALQAAVDLSVRYISDRALPDKAIDLIDEACSRVKLRHFSDEQPGIDHLAEERADLERSMEAALSPETYDIEEAQVVDSRRRQVDAEIAQLKQECEQSEAPLVLAEDIADIVSMWTNIPVSALTQAESRRLLCMEDEIHEDMVGQDEAIATVAKAIRRARAGVKDPRRPMGSFIFLGPTGVGKTLLAQTLAKFLFGDREALIRIDMSEYMEKFAVSRLIGAPPGYVGYEESGQLSEAVRRRPYSVVLFDEIEKAHPEVFNILLQIMEDGRLTDAQGRTVDFKNAVVIMTSNAGARTITSDKPLGFSTEESEQVARDRRKDYTRMKNKVTEELRKTFSPEFLNRVDDVMVFHTLTPEQIEAIVDLEVRNVREQLAARGLKFEITERMRQRLSEEGYNPDMGARPLRRAVREFIEDPVAERLLEEDKGEYTGRLSVDINDDGEVTVEIQEEPVAVTN